MDNGASSYRRFLDGDENALSEIVDEYCDGLIFYINTFVNNISVAEDIAEDTFVKILLKRPKNNFKASFKTWLYTIGRNAAIDHLRKESKNKSYSLEESELAEREEECLEEKLIKEENRIVVHRALKKIKSEYAQILYLIYFEEMSNKEAARIMKRSVHSVENLVYRARKALKEQLEKEGYIYENT